MNYISLVLSPLLLAFLPLKSFAAGHAADAGVFSQTRSYQHEIFETSEECEVRRADGFFMNCNQMITFEPDGSATVILTDIINPARYEISGTEVVVRADGSGELDKDMVFEISDNRRHLIRKGTNQVWDWKPTAKK